MNDIDIMFAEELRGLHDSILELREVMDNEGVKYGLTIAASYFTTSQFWKDNDDVGDEK